MLTGPAASPAAIASRVIAAIGRSDFPERLHTASRVLAGCDLYSAVLIAALRRHTELMERKKQIVLSHSRSVLVRQAREWGLSEREAEVAAGLVTGQSQSDIAKAAGLALNSVITYRRRAYQKLKVADRLELRAMCERLIPLAEP
jgi:DNA-binding CsgD family transcriptional regulator